MHSSMVYSSPFLSLANAPHTTQELDALPNQHRLRGAPVDLLALHLDQLNPRRCKAHVLSLAYLDSHLVTNA